MKYEMFKNCRYGTNLQKIDDFNNVTKYEEHKWDLIDFVFEPDFRVQGFGFFDDNQ